MLGALFGIVWAFVTIQVVMCNGPTCGVHEIGDLILYATGIVGGAAVGFVVGTVAKRLSPKYKLGRPGQPPSDG
jgi:hypothetical protein